MLKTLPVERNSIPWRERPVLTLQTASEVAGVSIASLYKFENAGRLTFRRLGGRTLVETRSLIDLVDTAEPWKASALTDKAVAARVAARA